MTDTLKQVIETINILHQQSNVPVLKNTPVVSPLYPGQFCYCLDEIQWYEKYGNFIDIPVGENFQKIQPAIRMRDFKNFYCGQVESLQHLGLFAMATVTGGKVISSEDGKRNYKESVHGILQLISLTGLNPAQLKVTYFSGNTAGNIEMSRKKETQERKILVNDYIPEDNFKEVLLECGINECQLEGVNTRDNYLTSNWYNIIAPWGYRNEFLYQLPCGEYLDIGTIERLTIEPVIQKVADGNRVIAIREWNKNIIINAAGIERLIMAVEKMSTIQDISLLAPFGQINTKTREALRILHRVFTDAEWRILSRQKKELLRFLMQTLKGLSVGFLRELLYIHAEQYRSIFPELSDGIEKTIEEIKNYRTRIAK